MVSVVRRPTRRKDRGWIGMVSVDRRPTGIIDRGLDRYGQCRQEAYW